MFCLKVCSETILHEFGSKLFHTLGPLHANDSDSDNIVLL